VITCPKCTKENQDHYKFCLGCGAELPRDASPKKFSPGTPPHGVAAVRGGGIMDESTNQGAGPRRGGGAAPGAAALAMGGVGGGAVQAAAYAPPQGPPPAPITSPPAAPSLGAAPPVICPQCEHPNPSSNKFCASCGFKLARQPSVQPAAAHSAPAAAPVGGGVVLTALRADGTEAGAYPLPGGTVTIGRDTGSVFAGDSYLSPRHATFTPRSGKMFVRDESSLNGIYRKLRREEPATVNFGDIFRIGQEIVRFEALTAQAANADGVERLGSPSKGYVGRVALIIGRDASGNAYPVPESGLHLGRERGDVLFPEDGYVSGLHCRISWQDGRLFLTDLGSSNGTFLRLSNEAEIYNGDILLMGQQLFRVTL
jgi:pSer/pThr/pTyr-binding forkhead associated (FHA) protein